MNKVTSNCRLQKYLKGCAQSVGDLNESKERKGIRRHWIHRLTIDPQDNAQSLSLHGKIDCKQTRGKLGDDFAVTKPL